MTDLDELALALPRDERKDVSDDGRPAYFVHGSSFAVIAAKDANAIDPQTGERLDDGVLDGSARVDEGGAGALRS